MKAEGNPSEPARLVERFTPGTRVRLKEPHASGVRYLTLLRRQGRGWLGHTAVADHGWQEYPHRELLMEEHEVERCPGSWMRYGIPHFRTLWKRMAAVPLGWLLLHANRRYRTSAFYELKDQVLKAYGRTDGNDLQVLPPKPCWECDGTGKVPAYIVKDGLLSPGGTQTCCDCHGTGEYQGKLYVQLVRRKLAWYVFHKPGGTSHDYGVAVDLWSHKNLIEGLIRHNPHPKWLGYWCRIALQMLFDFRGFGPHFVKVTAQRFKWRVQYATAPLRRKLGLSLASDEDQLPF